jgi:cytochrome P450
MSTEHVTHYKHHKRFPDLLRMFINDLPALADLVHKQCGGIGQLNIFGQTIYFVSDPDLRQELLRRENRELMLRMPASQEYAPLLGDYSLPVLPIGELWELIRQIVTKNLTPKVISEHYVPIIDGHVERALSSLVDGQQIDLHEFARDLIMTITMEIFAGDHGLTDKEMKAFSTAMADADAFLKWKAVLGNVARIPFFLKYRRYKKAIVKVHSIISRLIARAESRQAGGVSILDILLTAKREGKLTQQQVADTLITMFVAGQETTAEASTAGLIYYASNGPAASGLRDEVLSVTDTSTATATVYVKMPYVSAFGKETLRLLSPAPITGGQMAEALEVNGFILQQKAVVLLNTYSTHHSAKYYDNPEVFSPQRFIDNVYPPGVHNPFGNGGARACVGRILAEFEMAGLFGKVAQRLELKLVANQKIDIVFRSSLRGYNGRVMATVHLHHA